MSMSSNPVKLRQCLKLEPGCTLEYTECRANQGLLLCIDLMSPGLSCLPSKDFAETSHSSNGLDNTRPQAPSASKCISCWGHAAVSCRYAFPYSLPKNVFAICLCPYPSVFVRCIVSVPRCLADTSVAASSCSADSLRHRIHPTVQRSASCIFSLARRSFG